MYHRGTDKNMSNDFLIGEALGSIVIEVYCIALSYLCLRRVGGKPHTYSSLWLLSLFSLAEGQNALRELPAKQGHSPLSIWWMDNVVMN